MAAKQKKERAELRNDQTGQQDSQNSNYNTFNANQNERSQNAYNLGGSRSGDLWSQYQNIAANGGRNNSARDLFGSPSTSGSGGSGGGGGSVAKAPGGDYFTEAEGYARNLAGPTGGLNKEFYDRMMLNGGVDDEAKANFRGNGVFKEFQQTGGWNDADKANYRSRANSVLPAMYENLQSDLARRRNVQGGFAPGFDAASRAMARQRGQEMSTAGINTELGLQEQVNSGRRWGAEGGSQAENALQSLITGNQINTEGMANQGRVAGTGNLTQIAGGRTQRDSSAAATGAANRSIDAANARFLAQQEWEREQFGITGAQGLYQFDMGQGNQNDANFLQGAGQQDQMNANMFGGRQAGIDATPGWQDTAGTLIGAAAPIAGAAFGGGMGGIAGGGGGISGPGNPWIPYNRPSFNGWAV